MKNKMYLKNFVWNSIGSTINAFSSFFFLVFVTRINDINIAGMFSFGFSLATLLSYIGLYYGRVYQVSTNSKFHDSDFTVTRIITSLIMFLFGLIFVYIRNYSLYKSLVIILLCFFKTLEVFFDNYYAIFQKNDFLYKVGISQTLKGTLGIIFFIVVDIVTNNVIFSILSLIFVNVIVFLLYDCPNFRLFYGKVKFKRKNVISLLRNGLCIFLIYFFTMYLSNSAKFFIDFNLSDDFQTIFNVIIMPATFVILCVQYMIQPFVVNIRNTYLNRDYQNLKSIIFKMCMITILMGVIIIVLGFFIGIPILSFIYGIDFSNYKASFMVILLGSIIYGIVTIFSNILIILKEDRLQLIIFFLSSVFSTILSYLLIVKYEIFGASVSYTLTMLFTCLLLLLVIIFSFRKEGYNEKIEK